MLTQGYVLIDFREREKGQGKRKRKKHQLVAYHTYPDWGWNLQPSYMPWQGIEPTTFWYMGWCSNQLKHLVRALAHFLKSFLVVVVAFFKLTCSFKKYVLDISHLLNILCIAHIFSHFVTCHFTLLMMSLMTKIS